MYNAKQAFLRAIKEFPNSMAPRKRPYTSNGGKYIHSIMDEIENIQIAFEEYKSDFFLLSYVGREDSVMEVCFAAYVGEVDSTVTLDNLTASITEDARVFLQDPKTYVLLQNGYLLLHSSNVPKGNIIRYTYNDFSYGAKLIKYPLWNIFDEFAKFSSLTRFDGESNKDLMQRIFLAYRNPTNSTEAGLKNVIINSVSNEITVQPENIIIEKPNRDNMSAVNDDMVTVYEKLAQFNQDIFRTKRWDMDTWEHAFADFEYLPHEWDTTISYYQDGTGQADDLKVGMTSDLSSDMLTTDLIVTGYEASEETVSQYVSNRHIKKEIPLKLTRYKNELKPVDVQYKIEASSVKKIDPKSIRINALEKVDGIAKHYISDLLLNPNEPDLVNQGKLESGIYYLEFKPKKEYCSMQINRAKYTDAAGTIYDLLTETRSFKKVNGILKNVDVLAHTETINDYRYSNDAVNTEDGVTAAPNKNSFEVALDVAGMEGKPLILDYDCKEANITYDTNYVSTKGFDESPNGGLISNNESENVIEIDINCRYLSFGMLDAKNSAEQATCSVIVEVDGSPIAEDSGVWIKGRTLEKIFDSTKRVHITIRKMGMYEIEFSKITAKQYEIETWLESGEIQKNSFGFLLPSFKEVPSRNLLHVKFLSQSTYAPVLHYVHVGASMKNVTYTGSTFGSVLGGELDISTDCTCVLHKVSGDTDTIINNDYDSKTLLKNTSSVPKKFYINIDSFVRIDDTSVPIYKDTTSLPIRNYIVINGGDSLEYVMVKGLTYKTISNITLAEAISVGTMDEVFISKDFSGFIIRNTVNGNESLRTIHKDSYPNNVNVFEFLGLPDDIQGVYATSLEPDNIQIGPRTEKYFDTAYLELIQADYHVAYNKYTVLSPTTKGISMINTFSPLMNFNQLMLYRISEIDSDTVKATVNFEKMYNGYSDNDSWALGATKTVCINAAISPENSTSYQIETRDMSENFTVSNTIPLDDKYTIDGEEVILSQFIITSPEDMIINYKEDNCGESIIVEEDGFNKLYYSNITSILSIKYNNTGLSTNDYSYLASEGVIVWKNKKYVGCAITIMYSYKKPISLTFANISSLYSIVNYNVMAYKKISELPITYKAVKDKATVTVNYIGKKIPDKITAECTNINFTASVNGKTIVVRLTNDHNSIMVSPGYFYENGMEYYMAANAFTENADRANYVNMHNVRRYADSFEFIQDSTNYITNSKMSSSKTAVVCKMNCADINMDSNTENLIGSISACDSYNGWNTFNMDVELTEGLHGKGLKFSPKREDAYAVLNITSGAINNNVLVFYASAGINASIFKSIDIDTDLSIIKKHSVYAEPLAKMETISTYRKYLFKNVSDDHDREHYYLVITGNGVIDDIVTRNNSSDFNSIESACKTNLDKTGLNIKEFATVGDEISLDFDVENNVTHQIEIDHETALSTGSNIDWGLTKIYSSNEAFDNLIGDSVNKEHDGYYTNEVKGKIKTPILYINNSQSIRTLYIKVNDILIDSMKDFDMSIIGSDTESGEYRELISVRKTNLVKMSSLGVPAYLQVVVTMPAHRVINNIEIFAEYSETIDPPRLKRYSDGIFISKVYDIGTNGNFRPARLVGYTSKLENIRFYTRACRSDANDTVWTDWKEYVIDEDMNLIGNHVFEGYENFQFKIDISNPDAKILIKDYVLEVV